MSSETNEEWMYVIYMNIYMMNIFIVKMFGRESTENFDNMIQRVFSLLICFSNQNQ